MKGAISLGVGEPDFDTPWHIREEGIYSLEKGRTFYTSNSGLKELRQEICHYLKRRQRLEYDPNTEVMVTVGGSEAIDIALRAMLNPGDEVLIPQPSYVSYVPCTVLAGGTPVIIELEEKDEFRLTPEKLLEKITPKTKVLILPFPNNPTGAIMNRTDLEAIAKVIEEKDLFVLSDEIYSELTYSGKHVSIAEISGMRDRTVLINGFSKAYAMTGWRLGYAAAPALILKQMLKIHQFAIMCAPTTSQYAAVDALRNGDEDIARMKKAYDERRRYLLREFRVLGMDCFEPYGAFYMFPCIKPRMNSQTACYRKRSWRLCRAPRLETAARAICVFPMRIRWRICRRRSSALSGLWHGWMERQKRRNCFGIRIEIALE